MTWAAAVVRAVVGRWAAAAGRLRDRAGVTVSRRLERHRRAATGTPGGGRTAVFLTEVRSALAAGAAPGAALVAGVDRGGDVAAPLRPLADAVRLGTPLADVAVDAATGSPVLDLLVRALGVAERTGSGGAAAVEQALTVAEEEAEVARRVRARTAQARGTARVLTALPLLAWAGFVLLDPALLGFYATPIGAGTALLAVLLVAAGTTWSRRIVGRAAAAPARRDPLQPSRPAPDLARAAVLAGPPALLLTVALGPVPGIVVGAAVAALGVRRGGPGPLDLRGGGAAEAVELTAVALASGLSPTAALAAVAPLAPPAARAPLQAGARRLRGGWRPDDAFADTGLVALGGVLAASERWGAPAAPALRRLAAELRNERRAVADEAAERVQLALVFPTTLLTLPAFTVGVVPPMVWSAFTGAWG